jgi:hypothetical protein
MLIVTGSLLIISILMNNLIVSYMEARYLRAMAALEQGEQPPEESAKEKGGGS